MDFRYPKNSRIPYDAVAAFIGVMAVILYWIVRS